GEIVITGKPAGGAEALLQKTDVHTAFDWPYLHPIGGRPRDHRWCCPCQSGAERRRDEKTAA
ncbi:hypothetical protein, partial [Candidatus Mycobacterium methanotrophicum]|uniref:hypothetical protein n=1 Tax=Candidatus Mycobacterium methanotrophicum TaxID=2943498 RepID=UPI001C564820